MQNARPELHSAAFHTANPESAAGDCNLEGFISQKSCNRKCVRSALPKN